MSKSISWRKLVQKFRALGFDGPFSGGRHLFMARKDGFKVRIPNPHRADISQHLLAEILSKAHISIKEWEEI